ncbi:MAG: S8 family serine peptidase [Myxococcota bacterium]
MGLRLGLGFLSCVLFASSALAQNPAWPNRGASVEDMRDPANWPDDPSYGFDISGTGESCIGDGLRCWDNTNGGQWNLWSFVPPSLADRDSFRQVETELGAGTWTDMAWTLTTGDRRVLIAILDSGINWDERDLTNQFYLNRAELESDSLDPRCRPTIPDGHEGDSMDIDGDNFLSMRDWFAGLSGDAAAALRTSLDEDGNRNGLADPGDLITICSDDVDDDGNGYTDDISGWDFHSDDNDPMDDTRYGHGTGEARWSAAEGNNGIGRIGFCPHCSILMVRAADSFVADAQDFAQSVIFSVDSGATVIQEALGSINGTTYMRRAIDYAYDNNAVVIASAADENSYHHNLPGTANHTLYIHAIRFAGSNPQNSDSFLAFSNCTNYGGQLAMSAPGTGCSSEATAVGAGISGLMISAALADDRPGGPLDPPLSAEEIMQIFKMEADDIHVPESQPDHPDFNSEWYPSLEGWDQRFGWGRTNSYKSVLAVWEGRIPPEVDITTPDWFRVLYPARDGSVTLRGHIDARRAENFDYVIEWAAGIEPTDDEFQVLDMQTGVTEAVDGDLATWDISGLDINNPAEQGAHNRYTVTIRIRAVAHYGGEIGDVRGETRRTYSIAPDDTLKEGFPLALGVQNGTDIHRGASGEGSPKLADIDGDDILEIVYGDADGLLHVINGDDATEVPGFPVQIGRLRGLDPDDPNNVLGSDAYESGDVPADDVASSLLASAAVGDLDGDGSLEIVVTTIEGDIWAVEPDGSIRTGFPIALPNVPSSDPRRMGPANRDSIVERGAFASPALADLDDDDQLEIIQPAFDGNVHVFRADGSVQPGFPVEITAPQLWRDEEDAQPSRIMTSPAIGDANGDDLLDIAVGSNEYGDDSGSGAIHLIHGDGNLHEGGAAHENWPVQVVSLELLPLVGRGTTSNVAMADADGDGVSELAITGTASQIFIVPGVQPARGEGERELRYSTLNSGARGLLSNISDPIDRPLLNTFASGSFGDFDQDGIPDFTTGGAGVKLAANLAGGYKNEPFAHQIGMWTTQPPEGSERRLAAPMDGFPQQIEDYLFFMNPTSADVSGDGYPEVVVGSAGYWLHAWDACGEEAPGFPKFMGSWIIASPALGDVDGDGMLEVVSTTRLGYMFVFDTEGPADGSITWPEWRHDNHNSGNFDMDLPNGGSKLGASTPIVCDIPVRPDAGTEDDAGAVDAGTDAPTGPGVSGGGCDCATGGSTPMSGISGLILLGWVLRRRRV